MTEDTTSPRRRAAVEAAIKAAKVEALSDDWRRVVCMSIAAYEDGMGRTLDAEQIRRMADERA